VGLRGLRDGAVNHSEKDYIRVYAWTVDEPDTMRALVAMGPWTDHQQP
jgi:hypothetical protein